MVEFADMYCCAMPHFQILGIFWDHVSGIKVTLMHILDCQISVIAFHKEYCTVLDTIHFHCFSHRLTPLMFVFPRYRWYS
jgi:hypothetical protein